MQTKLKVILAVIIGVIIVVSTIPIISEFSTDITVSQYNENTRYNIAEDEERIEVSWSEAGGLKINAIEGIFTPLGLVCNNLLYMTQNNQVLIHDIANNKLTQTATPPNIVFENGTFSYTVENRTYTGSYDFLFHADKVGDFAIITGSATSNATFNANIGDEVFILSSVGYRSTTSAFSPILMYKYIDGVQRETLISPVFIPGNTTPSDLAISWDPTTTSHNDLYYTYTTNGTINYTINSNSDTVSILYIIPAKFETTNSMTETVEKIVQFIPLMLIIALLIMAAYAIMGGFNKKNSI